MVTVVGECRVCGCTAEMACPGGCHWVALDVCSHCSYILEAPNTVVKGIFGDELFEEILGKVGLKDAVDQNQARCYICNDVITRETLGSFARFDNEFKPFCQQIGCMSDMNRLFLFAEKFAAV